MIVPRPSEAREAAEGWVPGLGAARWCGQWASGVWAQQKKGNLA